MDLGQVNCRVCGNDDLDELYGYQAGYDLGCMNLRTSTQRDRYRERVTLPSHPKFSLVEYFDILPADRHSTALRPLQTTGKPVCVLAISPRLISQVFYDLQLAQFCAKEMAMNCIDRDLHRQLRMLNSQNISMRGAGSFSHDGSNPQFYPLGPA